MKGNYDTEGNVDMIAMATPKAAQYFLANKNLFTGLLGEDFVIIFQSVVNTVDNNAIAKLHNRKAEQYKRENERLKRINKNWEQINSMVDAVV